MMEKTMFFDRHTLFILVGTSGSGKSTFARNNFRANAIVSSDHCRAIIADFQDNQRVSQDAFELFYFIIEKRLKNGFTVIADSTALQKKYRDKLKEIAEKYKYQTIVFFFDIPQEICLENDKKRRYTVGEEVLSRQGKYLEQTRQELEKESYHRIIVFRSLEEIRQFSCYFTPKTHTVLPAENNSNVLGMDSCSS